MIPFPSRLTEYHREGNPHGYNYEIYSNPSRHPFQNMVPGLILQDQRKFLYHQTRSVWGIAYSYQPETWVVFSSPPKQLTSPLPQEDWVLMDQLHPPNVAYANPYLYSYSGHHEHYPSSVRVSLINFFGYHGWDSWCLLNVVDCGWYYCSWRSWYGLACHRDSCLS